MGLMRALKGLFGGEGTGGGASPGEAVSYGDYTIQPTPERAGSGWNTAGVIAKTIDGEIKEHRFIRVDNHASRDEALAFSVTKAKLIIDQMGDRLFDNPH